MKMRKIGYWAATAVVALAFGAGGVFDLSGSEQVVGTMQHLGYPAYLAALLGVWKVLGTVAVLVPGFGRVKEWAYAGMFFDLTGAAVSHAAVGDPAPAVLTPMVILGFVAISWALRPENRKFGQPEADVASGRSPLVASAPAR